MMNRAGFIDFTDSPSFEADAFVVQISPGLTSADALLQILYERARLPGYFGSNVSDQRRRDEVRDAALLDGRDDVSAERLLEGGGSHRLEGQSEDVAVSAEAFEGPGEVGLHGHADCATGR
jgi:hypothetical protein